jgi:hypothetical protein
MPLERSSDLKDLGFDIDTTQYLRTNRCMAQIIKDSGDHQFLPAEPHFPFPISHIWICKSPPVAVAPGCKVDEATYCILLLFSNAWLLGCLAAWLLGCLAAWLLGCE